MSEEKNGKEMKWPLHDCEGRSTGFRIQVNDLLETHHLEERLGVHSFGGCKVGSSLLQRVHGLPYGVEHGNTGHERED